MSDLHMSIYINRLIFTYTIYFQIHRVFIIKYDKLKKMVISGLDPLY